MKVEAASVRFAVFPYLRTHSRFRLRGIDFRNIQDIGGLADDEKQHLAQIHSILYLRNNVRPAYITYAVVRLGPDAMANKSILENLNIAQLIVSHLYTNPDHWDGSPFFPSENASLFVFEPKALNRISVAPERYSAPHSDYYLDVEPADDPSVPYHASIAGYRVVVNRRYSAVVAQGSRLYAPYYGVYVNYSQSLDHNLSTFFELPTNWALQRLGQRTTLPTPEEQRVLTAMEWYQRSAEGITSEEEALVHLAIAFESLLGLEHGNDHTMRFKEAVLILLGRVDRLGTWIEQFYTARSKIVHQGHFPHLLFNPDKKNKPGVDANAEEGELGPLTSYGRLVFRLCLNARLSGITATDESVLTALLADNQARLEGICEKLNKDKESTPAGIRIHSIARQVAELSFYWAADAHNVRLDTALAVGKMLIAAYLETAPPEKAAIQNILDELDNKVTPQEKLEHLMKVSTSLPANTYRDEYHFAVEEDPPLILSAYLKYVQKLPTYVL